MKCKLMSHPGKLLKTHLEGTLQNGMDIFKRNGIYKKHENFIYPVLLLHDLGKASSYFQDYISGSKQVKDTLKRHAEISALWFYFYSKEVLNFSEKFCVLGYLLIKCHHADFGNFDTMCAASLNKDEISQINNEIDYDELKFIFKDRLNTEFFGIENFEKKYENYTNDGGIKRVLKIRKALEINDYLFLNYFFSILLTADKSDAILNDKISPLTSKWPENAVDEYKKKFLADDNILTIVRNKAYLEAESNLKLNSRFFSLNLPTGAGKTLNVLNTALKLKKKKSLNKIIYCLPFTSVIDQNAKVFEDVLSYNNVQPSSDIILKHHHLTELNYIRQFEDENKIYSSKDSEFYIEGWESELIVTTFFQVLHTFFSNKNKSLRKFHNLSNSIVILDEVQSIPLKYWELINLIFKYCAEEFNIYFVLVTATMPLIFSEEKNEIEELAISKKSYFDSLGRIKLNTKNIKEKIHINDFKETALHDVNQNPVNSRLFIMNTVKSSLDLYNYFKEHIPEENLVYLSSNIIPKERINKIADIKKNPQGRIIVSTQLVEAGVDIDVDVVYRDIAPLDSIFQACGRCNRNNNASDISEVKLFLITDDKKLYSSYIYDQVFIDSTLEVLKSKKEFHEKEFLHLSELYFQKIKERYDVVDSKNILENIESLFYFNAFSKSAKPEHKIFELIEPFSTVSAFIEIDEEASDIYETYQQLFCSEFEDPFEKRRLLKDAYKKMSPYIINIPEPKAKNCGYDETLGKIWFITRSMVEELYSTETGFNRDKEIVDFIF
ncbi:MAG: CRISPR-associated helicase Cas3' [Candidatus Muiribacteriota bacterium]